REDFGRGGLASSERDGFASGRGDLPWGDGALEVGPREDWPREDWLRGDWPREDWLRGDWPRGDWPRGDWAREEGAREDWPCEDWARGGRGERRAAGTAGAWPRAGSTQGDSLSEDEGPDPPGT